MPHGRYTARKAIRVPDEGTGVHVPERIEDSPGRMVRWVEFFALGDNSKPVWIGWSGTTAAIRSEAGIELTPGDSAVLKSPLTDDDGRPQEFDLYDVYISGTVDDDAVTYMSW